MWDFLVAQGQKLGTRGHRALLEHSPGGPYRGLGEHKKNKWNKSWAEEANNLRENF